PPPRQRAPLAGRSPRAPAAGPPADASEVRPQGEAPVPPQRVRDGGVCLHARHRLRGRGVPEQRRCDAARVQGRTQSPGGRQPGHEARLRARVHPFRPGGVRGARRRGGERTQRLQPLRDASLGRGVQLLPARRRGGEQASAARRRACGVTTSAADDGSARALLRDREPVMLLDRRGRGYLRPLRQGGRVTVRGGPIACDTIIGRPEGSMVETAAGERFLVLRPTYAQLIPNLPRRAQPIYPKDVGPLLLWGDIGPGATVVEVGTGPGALTIALLRAVGPTGRLVSYELRAGFADMTPQNVARFHGPAPHWTLRVGDAFAGICERQVDRIVVDLAEPWRLLGVAADALRAGGIFIAFVPTVLQVKELVDALRAHGAFATIDA